MDLPPEIWTSIATFLPGPLERIAWQRTCVLFAGTVEANQLPVLLRKTWADASGLVDTASGRQFQPIFKHDTARGLCLVLREGPAWLWTNENVTIQLYGNEILFSFCFEGFQQCLGARQLAVEDIPQPWRFTNEKTGRTIKAKTFAGLGGNGAGEAWQRFVSGDPAHIHPYICKIHNEAEWTMAEWKKWSIPFGFGDLEDGGLPRSTVLQIAERVNEAGKK